jgi:hypothetical protein
VLEKKETTKWPKAFRLLDDSEEFESEILKNTAQLYIKYAYHGILVVCHVCRSAGSTRNYEGRFYLSLNHEAVPYFVTKNLPAEGRGGSSGSMKRPTVVSVLCRNCHASP